MFVLSCIILSLCSICAAQSPEPNNLHVGLSEGIGNFSIELLFRTAEAQQKDENFILSPFTVWTALAVLSEGATGNTQREIKLAARIGRHEKTRINYKKIVQYLNVTTSTVQLAKVNCLFIDHKSRLERDFKHVVTSNYALNVQELDFEKADESAKFVNSNVENFTHGRIKELVQSSSFTDTKLILVSGVYFKGQWTAPFDAEETQKRPFYNCNGKVLGEVNMMYRRHNFPFANIKDLQARIIELPYGVENRLSMLIMVPYKDVTLNSMFLNFKNVPLDAVFTELKIAQDEFSDDLVDCYIPRFKIESETVLNEVLMGMNISDMFDPKRALFADLARVPVYVSKVVHKAEIEVTEEGTTASGVTAVEFANRISIVRFEANRPFAYMIIEKITNTIVFGGLYQTPVLY